MRGCPHLLVSSLNISALGMAVFYTGPGEGGNGELPSTLADAH
jgi:hypothetical protein